MNQITEELRHFVVDNFLFGQGDGLRDDTSFLEDGIVDSTGVLELIGFLDSRFGIQLDDDEIVPDNLDSLERLTRFVERKIASAAEQMSQCA
jgi:acyl carrier protein